MKRESTPPVPVTESRILFYQSEDGTSRIEVRLEEGTVWLPQVLIAELYQTTKQNISLHIRNIFDEGELQPEATVKEYLTVHVPSLRARELLVDPPSTSTTSLTINAAAFLAPTSCLQQERVSSRGSCQGILDNSHTTPTPQLKHSRSQLKHF